MRSRQATQAIIEKDTVYLITIMKGKIALPLAGAKNVKEAYAFAKMVGQINEMNRSYKSTIRDLKKDLITKLWDKSKYGDCLPESDYVDVRPIKMI